MAVIGTSMKKQPANSLAPPIRPPQGNGDSALVSAIKTAQGNTASIRPPAANPNAASAISSQIKTAAVNTPSATPAAAPAIAPPVANYAGGANYGTADAAGKQSLANAELLLRDPSKIPGELARTEQVIRDLESQGLDTTDQQKHLSRLQGQQGLTGGTGTIGTNGFGNVPDWLTSGYEADIADQIKAYQDQLNSLGYDYTKAQNALKSQQAVDTDSAQQFQNRRGGLYSGGYDYQVGGINANYAQRNADLEQMYGSNLNTIQSEIAKLQSGAPDELRRRVEEWANNQASVYGTNPLTGQKTSAQTQQDWLNKFDYGQAIGQFGNGQKTLDMKQFESGEELNEFNKGITMAELTGSLPNGQKTTSEQQRQLENMWMVAQQTGSIPDSLADMYGIPRGTRTQDAIAQAEDIALGWAAHNLDVKSENRIAAGKSSTKKASDQYSDEKTISDLNLPRTVDSMVTYIKNNLPGISDKMQGPPNPNQLESVEQLILSNPNFSEKEYVKLYQMFGIPLPE